MFQRSHFRRRGAEPTWETNGSKMAPGGRNQRKNRRTSRVVVVVVVYELAQSRTGQEVSVTWCRGHRV